MHRLFKGEEGEYWRSKIVDGRENSKKLWLNLSGLTNANSSKHVSTDHTADDFDKFFSKKIEDIREETPNATRPDIHHRSPVTLDFFAPVTKEEVVKLLRGLPGKICNVDPVLSHVIKRQAEALDPWCSINT